MTILTPNKTQTCTAYCETCDWRNEGAHPEAAARKHAKKYGHRTVVVITIKKVFDEPPKKGVVGWKS